MSLPSKCACLALLLIPAVPVQATPLSAPRILGATQITRTGETVETIGFGTIDVVNEAFGAAELTMSGIPMPFIIATAIGAPDPINNSVVRAVGQIEYFISVAGPAGQVPVEVTVSGNAHATTGLGSSYVLESSWSIVGDGVNVGDAIRTGQQPGSFDQGFGRTVSVTLTLLHEAYLKLSADGDRRFSDRLHFLAVASRVMRQVLVDHARARATAKRGGLAIVHDDGRAEAAVAPASEPLDMLRVHRALEAMAREDEGLARLIEMRYFGGLVPKEMAELTHRTVHAVRHDLRFAQAWLRRELRR